MKKELFLIFLTALIIGGCNMGKFQNSQNSNNQNNTINESNSSPVNSITSQTVEETLNDIDSDINGLNTTTDFEDQFDKDFSY